MSTEVALSPKQSADNALIALIATAAQDQSIDVSKLQQLVELRERILAKEAEIAFNVAMNEAQGEMNPIVKDAKNPHAGNRYATLEQVDREIRPIYAKHGFCLTFNTATPVNPNAVHVTCEVRHSAGHKKEYFLEGDLDVSGSQGKSNKTSIQGLGSSVSYLRRYLTLMIFNLTLTNEDNDGNGNKAAYDAMRHAADARQAARQAAEQAVPREPVYEEVPFEPMPVEDEIPAVDLAAQLRASTEMVEAQKPKKGNTLNAYQIKAAKLFKPLHDQYLALNQENRYRAQLKSFGVAKSTHFDLSTPGGRAQAERCVAIMVSDLRGLEERLAPRDSDIDIRQEESPEVSKPW